jgi:hypothetical protein
MPIDLTSNNNNPINGSIDYNYGRISLYPSNFLSDGSVSLNYSSPNIIVNINDNNSTQLNKSYIAKKIYINDTNTHGLGEGEIVIEHKDFMGNTEKLFLIIPANKKKNVPKIDNAINSLIGNLYATTKSDIDFNFNINLDNKSGYYYYTHTDNSIKSHFIVFEESIDIKDFPDTQPIPSELTAADAAAAAPAPAFSIYKGENDANKTDKGVVNSMSSKEDQIYIDCQPTGVSKETISSYNVPINSEYTENSALLNFERSTTTIVLFSVACVLSFLVGPELYKMAIINNIIRHIGNPKGFLNKDDDGYDSDNEDDERVYKNEQLLGGVDSLLVIMIFWIFIAMLGVGVHFKSSLTTTSLYFLMFAISMMLGIYNKRQDKTYMTHTTHNDLEYTLYEWFFDSKKNIYEKVDYNFMGYNIKGIGGITQEVFRQWAKLIAFLLASGLSIGLIAGLLKGEARDLYGSIIMPILFIVYIILLLAGLEKEAKKEQSVKKVDNGLLGTIGNFFGKLFPRENNVRGGGENNGVFIGGSSDDYNNFSDDFSKASISLIGVAGIILTFASLVEQKSDK